MPTPGDHREDHAQRAASLIQAEYADAELVIIAALAYCAVRLANGSMSRAQALRYLRRSVAYAMTNLSTRVRALIAAALVTAFREALRDHGHKLPPPPGEPGKTPEPIEWRPPFTQARMVAEWQAELSQLLDQAGNQAAKTAEAELAQVAKAIEAAKEPENPYQAALGRALEAHGGWPGSTLSARRIRAAQAMLDELARRGITGFTDRKGRRWDLASYAEMATRTVVSNMWDDMQAKAAARAGIDLADIGTDSTEGTCPHCLPYLGTTISLSGETPGYVTLAEAKEHGFRHPGCRCTWTPRGLTLAPLPSPVPLADAAEAYAASQRQRALERAVRKADRAYQSAITPKARGTARRGLHAARNASEAHRARHGVIMTKVGARRRERHGHAR